MDASNEKAAAAAAAAASNNNPYQQRAVDPFSNSQSPLSPFRDQGPPTPYQDNPTTAPIYTARSGAPRRGNEEGHEMQVGFAR